MTEEKDALQYTGEQAVTAAEKRIITKGSRQFLINGNGDVEEYRPDDGARDALHVHTLTAVVDYIKQTQERLKSRLIVQINDQNNVNVFGELDKFGNRETLLTASALHPNYRFGDWLDQEEFMIALQSQFVDAGDRGLLMKLVGNLKDKASKTLVDDGVTQIATAQTGVASVSEVKVPNPVVLQPYRTFLEVEQPASQFVFRLHNGPSIGLFEADGSQWRNEAINNIDHYLSDALKDDSDRVTILA
ncbi:hypothetical protein HWN39_10565 [Lactobacillus rhamnosus]|uniref:Phage protein n=1 Tax=Lacticaseibacillus rhamnosus TaxID=47715 RepID=A0A7Y7QH88_LACRH|nr:hypothetical protein [Lacticaseibacillus rhamnosus]NVO88921.1 hypothetical protein [Lacticaseibacillus rhamnosus]